jgi:hypothetical protein
MPEPGITTSVVAHRSISSSSHHLPHHDRKNLFISEKPFRRDFSWLMYIASDIHHKKKMKEDEWEEEWELRKQIRTDDQYQLQRFVHDVRILFYVLPSFSCL